MGEDEEKSREYRIRVGAVNIVARPHPPGTYKALLLSAKRQKKIGRIYGTRRGIISSVRDDQFDDDIVRGEFATFTEIAGTAWLDLQEGTAVTEEDEEEIRIPSHMRPNLRFIPFMLSQRKHRLVFDLSLASSAGVADMLREQLVAANPEHRIFVHAVRRKATLEDIFAIQQIQRLTIVIRPVNLPDDLGEYEEEIMKRMEDQHVEELTEVMKSKEGIDADDRTLAAANVAIAEDGYVDARGLNDGVPAKKSTTKKAYERVFTQEARDRAAAVYGGLRQAIHALRGK